MRHTTFSLFAVGLLACSPARAAIDMFLCMPPLVGETQDSGFQNCIDVLTMSDAAFQEGNLAEPRDLRINKYVDTSSMALRRIFVDGTELDEAILYIRTTGAVAGPSGAHISIRLIQATVTSFAGSIGGGDDRAVETVSLRGQKIEYMYRRKGGAGPLLPPTYTCWDVTTGQVTASQC
jgi:type VI protein secretion system component Hcp